MSKRGRCDASQLKQGDYISRRQYLRVTGLSDGRVSVRTDSGFEFNATEAIASETMLTCDQFSREEKVSATELVEKLIHSNGDIFTVNFHKQANEKTVVSTLQSATVEELSDARSRKALAKRLKVGEERTLIGYLLETEPMLGRSKVIDLEQAFAGEGWAQRLVDHRTINWIILRNVKYVRK